jgi:fructokinase
MHSGYDKSAKSVILFGEALVDVFPDGAVVGGAPFNVARHLQAFGLHPILVTRTGNDDYRQKLIKLMQRFGMSISGVQCDMHYPTGQVLIEFGEKGHEFEILADQAYDFIDSEIVRDIVSSVQPDLVYFGTLAQRNQISRKALEEILQHTSKVPRFFDINLRKPWYSPEIIRYSLTQADYAKMNEDELIELPKLLGMQTNEDAHAVAQYLIEDFQLKSVLVTAGSDGAWLLDRTGTESRTSGIENVTIKDTVGAGDGFSAVSILGLLFNWPGTLVLERANRFAAAICGMRGAIPESAEFYSDFLKEWDLSIKIKQ